ncbi:MAG: hypothetical protein FWF84_00830 [Kiritimatiellaeota bacterium]|nr:hypothetical protein [Kiritimatiellota bacterium]
MTIDVARLDEGGEAFEGEDPAAILEWAGDDEALCPGGGVRYALRAELLGEELLVRGAVSAAFDAVCCRCGKAMTLEVCEPEFCVSVPVPADAAFVDLTGELREAILLALPNHPVCAEECHAPAAYSPGQALPSTGWEALDALRVSTKKSSKKARRSNGGTQTKKV